MSMVFLKNISEIQYRMQIFEKHQNMGLCQNFMTGSSNKKKKKKKEEKKKKKKQKHPRVILTL